MTKSASDASRRRFSIFSHGVRRSLRLIRAKSWINGAPRTAAPPVAAAGISPKAVRQAASIDLKAQEPGILQLVEKYGWQYRTFSAEELETAEGEFTPSPFVKKITGIDNVCERSAVLAGGRLIKKKKAADGVTVALAAADWRAVF